ncbi:MAG: 3-mercaptopyruvate sulfurtransferase [Candidatus Marinimicrobia bacterium]|nr:3-mercaptopyruvate sulfurtransferase [Candidatus Neomarinimicrobiota bacterium]
MNYENPDALVTTEWLAAHLENPKVKILDASYFVPGGVLPARTQYEDAHIPGSIFFDINDIADKSKPKEHTFPTKDIFAAKVGALGIHNGHQIIIYDHLGGACAAARVWFMFRAFGHNNVAVLNGGRTKWEEEKRPYSNKSPIMITEIFEAHGPINRLPQKEDIFINIGANSFQVLDARSSGRFEGTEAEPREGLRGGHIPESRNLPFLELLEPDSKTWKNGKKLRSSFANAGIDLGKPLVTTCGSGVSACALALGAYLAGNTKTTIYDGSWVEWGADKSLPIETASLPVTNYSASKAPNTDGDF